MWFILFFISLISLTRSQMPGMPPISAKGVDSSNLHELRCLVCKAAVEHMQIEIEKVDPMKVVEVGSYRFDEKGNEKQKKVQYRRSEVFLTELMERVCSVMKDYIRARKKTNGELVIIPIMSKSGGMNPLMRDVDVIQDSDLNKSLEFYCEGILEEFEESFVKRFSKEEENLDFKICSEEAKLCSWEDNGDNEFNEDHEEL